MDGIKEFRVFYGFLLTVSATLCFFYMSRLSPLLFVILLIVPVISFILLLVSYKLVSISQSPDEIVTEKNKDCAFKVKIKNKSFLPVSSVTISGNFISEADGSYTENVVIADARARGEVVVEMPFVTKYRGEYIVGASKYEIFDILKLFKLQKNMAKRTTIVVLPRIINIGSLKNTGETESESSQTIPNGINPNTFSSFREYRMGDKMHQIHWKLTSKHDDFIVKQMEQSINDNTVIFCDFSAGEQQTVVSAHIMSDAVIETALAIVKRIVDDGDSTSVFWRNSKDGSDEYMTVSDENHFRELYYMFALLPFKPAEGSFGDFLRVFSDKIKEQQMVYLLTNKLDDEFVGYLIESGLAKRKDVKLLLFNTSAHNNDLLGYIAKETDITLIPVDVNNIAPSLSEVQIR